GKRFLLRVVESVLRIVLWLGVLTFALRLVAPSQYALLFAVGSAAVAVGLAARDLVRNWIGGLVIIAERPYEVGDRVTMAGTSDKISYRRLRRVHTTLLSRGVVHRRNAEAPLCDCVIALLHVNNLAVGCCFRRAAVHACR